MQGNTFDFELRIVINVIEVHHGKDPGIGSATLKIRANVGAFKLSGKYLRHMPARPFVEIAEHDARSFERLVAKHRFIDQALGLLSPFEERRSQMHVEYMQSSALREYIRAKASTLFAAHHAHVQIAMRSQGVAAENEVPVSISQKLPVLSECRVGAKVMRQVFALHAEYFLKRDDIRIHFRQDIGDALY